MENPVLLTMDDEPANQMLLKKLFSDDFQVHTAGSGLEAIKNSLEEIDDSCAEIGNEALKHLEDMKVAIETTFADMGLIDQDELKIMNIVKQAHQNIEQIYNKGLTMDMYIRNLKEQLQAIFKNN